VSIKTFEDLQLFWAQHDFKIWVVSLDDGKRKNAKRDRLIVRAKTEEGALSTAKKNSQLFHNRTAYGSARLACPRVDLGMKETKQAFV
jgi:hypothetical protein